MSLIWFLTIRKEKVYVVEDNIYSGHWHNDAEIASSSWSGGSNLRLRHQTSFQTLQTQFPNHIEKEVFMDMVAQGRSFILCFSVCLVSAFQRTLKSLWITTACVWQPIKLSLFLRFLGLSGDWVLAGNLNTVAKMERGVPNPIAGVLASWYQWGGTLRQMNSHMMSKACGFRMLNWLGT